MRLDPLDPEMARYCIELVIVFSRILRRQELNERLIYIVVVSSDRGINDLVVLLHIFVHHLFLAEVYSLREVLALGGADHLSFRFCQ